MRVTKEPEERRQEIIETAMRLFYEKGAMRRPPLRYREGNRRGPGIVLPLLSVEGGAV